MFSSSVRRQGLHRDGFYSTILMHAQVNISYLPVHVHLQPPSSPLVENIHFSLTSIG